MNKKLILTETQFDKLNKFINETKYDKVLKDSISVGDIVRIDYKNSTGNFKVINNLNGQIQMDNIDSGSANINYRYFINPTSLHGDDLEIRRVHKLKEKEKLTDIKSWQKIDVKDIKNIEVIRNGSVIDTVDSPIPTDIKAQAAREKGAKGIPDSEEIKIKISDVMLVFLNNVKEGNGLNLVMINKDVISLCCVGKGGNKFTFTLDSNTTIDELKNWDTFGIEITGDVDREDEDFYELNSNIIKTTDAGKTFNLNFLASSGDKTKNIWITGIEDVIPTPTCLSAVSDEEVVDTEEKVDSQEEAKKMMKIILDDPFMKKAFYKQPSLLNVLFNVATGKQTSGSGIGPAKNIISKYGQEKHKKALGPTGKRFKTNKQAKFEILDKEFFINPTGNPKDALRLESNAEYEAIVNPYKLGDNHLMLSNKRLGFKIIVLRPYKDVVDAYEVSIVKIIKTKTTGEIKEYPKLAVVKFINETGSGYSKDDLKNKR